MDHLAQFARKASQRVAQGYYKFKRPVDKRRLSLRKSIGAINGNAIITELKPAAPSTQDLLQGRKIEDIAEFYCAGGSAGFSVLTDSDFFGGSLANMTLVCRLGLPVLMKDFVLDPVQLEACVGGGGDAILLIMSIFERKYSKVTLKKMIGYAHELGIEILLEVGSSREFAKALEMDVQLVGINSRNLNTLKVDVARTIDILTRTEKKDSTIIVGMSGISQAVQIKKLKQAGCDAFLVGTALMQEKDPIKKLRELIEA